MKKFVLFSFSLLFVIGILLVILPDSAVGDALAKKGACTTIQSGELLGSDGSSLTTGYNEWGYNYQAHMFNGMWCDYHPTYRPGGSGHAWCMENMADVKLMMKWNDAWLSNKDCSGDGLLDRYYGFDSYIGSGAWLTNHERGSYKSLVGDWIISVDYHGKKYNHDMSITGQDGDGNLSGEGSYPAGGPYTIYWELEDSSFVDGEVYLELHYQSSSYVATLEGNVNEEGSLEGTWYSNVGQSGTWETTQGEANECEYNTFVKIVAVPSDAYEKFGYWYSAEDEEIGESIWGAFAIVQEVTNDSCAGEHGLLYKSPYGVGFGMYKPKPEAK